MPTESNNEAVNAIKELIEKKKAAFYKKVEALETSIGNIRASHTSDMARLRDSMTLVCDHPDVDFGINRGFDRGSHGIPDTYYIVCRDCGTSRNVTYEEYTSKINVLKEDDGVS